MADTAAPSATSAASKKTAKAKKSSATKKVASHPKYTEMISAALGSLKDRKGSSGQAIKKYIVATYKIDEKAVGPHLRLALKRGVASGAFKQVKGTGASGSFKLADKVAKPKKAPAVKKAKSPKKVKKTEKPAAAVKKTPKKSVKKAAKSPASKKPKAKKAKKPVAKKAAPKK